MGWSASPAWLLVWTLPLAAMLVWFIFASPKAPYGGPLVRPAAKVLVFSVVVNALAALPSIRGLVPEQSHRER